MAVSPTAAEVAAALQRGERPSERHFDRFLPDALRAASPYWSPLAVALKTAEWFRQLSVETVVDVGSGAGKLCVALALASECEVTGIEQRPGLIDAARELAKIFGVEDRVRFIHGELSSAPLPPAAGYYLYNPFGENLLPPGDCIDHDVELSKLRYQREVAWFEQQLALAPPSTCVVDYAGFGGRMSSGYRQLDIDSTHPYPLRLWQKRVG